MIKKIDIDSSYRIEYDSSRFLNKGNYANVYHAKLVCRKNKPRKKNFFDIFICAAKNPNDTPDENLIIKISNSGSQDIENEINILLELEDEPHIIHIKKVVIGELYQHYKFIALEYCKGGDLFNYLQKRNRRFDEGEVEIISNQLINAINSCHKHGIVHGDIKLENIGLMREEDITELKLLDFGGSYKIQHIDDDTIHSALEFHITSSPHYIPPELISDKILIKERELIYADFWELGVMCYILLTGIYPFGAKTNNVNDIKKHVLLDELRWPKNINISAKMKKYIEDLLRKRPQDRSLGNLQTLLN